MFSSTHFNLNHQSLISWNSMAFYLFVSLIVLLAGRHVDTFELCYLENVDLSAYHSDHICSDIDIVSVNSTEQYNHCRVVNGSVSIRHLKLKPNSTKLSFPNLEVITDFLLLNHISSEGTSTSLNVLFPRLRSIKGRRRLMNTTLYISHFYADDKIEMDSLIDVCGPVWLLKSPTVCFRHSPLYWRIQPKVILFDSIKEFNEITSKNIIFSSLHEDHFDARLRIYFELADSLRDYWKNFQFVRVSIYHIDQVQYNYMLHGVSVPPNCTEVVRNDNAFYLDDLIDSDNVNVFLRDHIKESIDNDSEPLANLPYTEKGITLTSYTKRNISKKWNFLHANYDIRHLSHDRINAQNGEHGMVETTKDYIFKFDEYYLIKVSICFGETIEECYISKFHRFKPTKQNLFNGAPFAQNKSDLSDLLRSPNLITAALIAAVLLTVAIIFVILTRYKSIMKKIHRSRFMSYRPVNIVSANPEYAGFSSIWSWDPAFQGNMFDDIACEISRSKVIILQQRLLGKGEFGYVHEGILFDENNCDCNGNSQHVRGHNSLRVAIKQLRDNARQIDKEKFMTEAKYMKTFNSNFLVKLIGVVTVQEPILVVMEYMENGDLKRYLRQKHLEFKGKNIFSLMPNLNNTIRMAIQIADGMHYLHSKKVIHRDLAARNCMVSQDLTVKIGDFGLTRHVYEKDYYRLSEQTPMPLRWMAPESVRKMIFTAQTDVWSYGVVLWEIMMFGKQPYKGTPDQDVKKMLVDCVRLPEPAYPNHVIWELAKKCWSKRPHNRPSFREIIELLYPHLDKQKAEFDNMSYYQSCRAQYRDPFSCSLTRLISHHCFAFMSKFTSGRPLTSLNHSQLDQCSDRSLHSGCHCLPSSGCRNHHRCSGRSNGHRPRCQSFDSLQSGSACSEMTTITSISSVSSQETSIDLRHSPNASEQIPLI